MVELNILSMGAMFRGRNFGLKRSGSCLAHINQCFGSTKSSARFLKNKTKKSARSKANVMWTDFIQSLSYTFMRSNRR